MELQQRINAFAALGDFLRATAQGKKEGALGERFYPQFENVIRASFHRNGWFTEEHVRYALLSVGQSLCRENMGKWISAYSLPEPLQPLTIGVIMAGNIPIVGFHDFICVLISGNIFRGKLSSDDKLLLPAIAEVLEATEPGFRGMISFTESKLDHVDAIIATGSNNSARYFDYYFSKYPHIIRKNRNSVAVLAGNESAEDLRGLGEDIFRYFGLGCRNVSKLFVPQGYNFDNFFKAMYEYRSVIDNKKYANNYEYNRTVYLMNHIKLLDNNFLLLREDISMHSPVAVLFYEYYASRDELADRLRMDSPNIQCIVAADSGVPHSIRPGTSQQPALWDYADRVDTLKFLLKLARV